MKSKLKKIGVLALFLVGGGTSFMGDSINNKAHASIYPVGICSSGKCAWTAKEYGMSGGGIWLDCKKDGTSTCCASCD